MRDSFSRRSHLSMWQRSTIAEINAVLAIGGHYDSGIRDDPSGVRNNVLTRLQTMLNGGQFYSGDEMKRVINAGADTCIASAKILVEDGIAEMRWGKSKQNKSVLQFKIRQEDGSVERAPTGWQPDALASAMGRWDVAALIAPYNENGDEHEFSK